MIFSIEGLVWIAAVLLVAAVFIGWLETPLQGVIRGYALPIFGDVAPGDALKNPPRLLSAALPCLLVAAVALIGAIRRRTRWPEIHVAVAMLVFVLCVPIVLTARHQFLVQDLVRQNEDRDAIREFASAIRNPITLPYSASLPARELAGDATLLARTETVFQLMGYGWWVALAGAGLLGVTAIRFVTRRHAALAIAGWGCAAMLGTSIVATPAVVAEYHRVRGDELYATGRYDEAVARFRRSLDLAPGLVDNRAFQYRLGATLVWLGDRASAPARLFVAQNLRDRGDLDKAELELKSALIAEPDRMLLRRRLAELDAERGVSEFARLTGPWREEFRPSTSEAAWTRANALDPSLLRLPYFLAHAYHRIDDRDQRRAIAEGYRLIALTRDLGILSDTYALLGDCYFKSRDDVTAREMYANAVDVLPLVKLNNLKAQRGLLGL